METHRTFRAAAWRKGRLVASTRDLAAETAIAISYNGTAHVVLMGTPADLEDLAIGFSLTEGIVASRDEIERIETVEENLGIDLRIWLKDEAAAAFAARRRNMAGPVGCGLCGIESLEAAMRDIPAVEGSFTATPGEIVAAVEALRAGQALNALTHSVHAAGFWIDGKLFAVREDVGRHNGLDKLIGAMATAGIDMGGGMVVVTSRLSVELVQKCAIAGCGVIVAISAPTALAVETAERAGITLVAIARGAEFEVFIRADRIGPGALPHVA